MTGNNHHLDDNLKRLLQSALDEPRPAFQERLVRDVLAEVARERHTGETAPLHSARPHAAPPHSRPRGTVRPRTGLPWWKALAWGAPALAALAVLGVWFASRPPMAGSVGELTCLYGEVGLPDRAEPVSGAVDLQSGQRVRTAPGSRAQIRLPDRTKILPDPRTTLQVSATRQGPRVVLEEGTVSIEAAKQAPGQAITIEAAQARVKVLGTRLDVRVVEKPSGTRQAHVRVLSGSVEVQSGGEATRLLPGTEGIAEDGQAPIRRSLVPEVNQLLALIASANASRPGSAAAAPAILDLANSTFWTVVPSADFAAGPNGTWSLRLKYPAFRVKAYSPEGASIPATGNGDTLRLHFPPEWEPAPEFIILKVPSIAGLLTTDPNGLLECRLPAGNGPATLLQLHLPASAQLDQVQPVPLETAFENGKLILTVPVSAQLPSVYYGKGSL